MFETDDARIGVASFLEHGPGKAISREPDVRRYHGPIMADTTEDLHALHEDYAHKVNATVADERWDVVEELSDLFLVESMALMTAAA